MIKLKRDALLSKIHELKALFIFGQRVMPFLEELFQFVQEVIPILEEMTASIRESTSRIPDASSKLNDVTRATELATMEILDTLDILLVELGDVRAGYRQIREELREMSSLDMRMARLIKKEIAQSHPALVDKLELMFREKRSLNTRLGERIAVLQTSLEKIHQNANNIMISLQVQDITTQQIAAVTHLIQSIENRLAALVESLDEQPIVPGGRRDKSSLKSFNPAASYTNSHHYQRRVDEIIMTLHSTGQSDLSGGDVSKSPDSGSLEPQGLSARSDRRENRNDKSDGKKKEITTQDEIDKLFESSDE